MEKKQRMLKLKDVIWIGMVFAVIPVLIFIGTFLLENKQYYLISILIIVMILIPFVMMFETRNPETREIVTIASMSGLAVISRVVFAVLPQVKPVSSIIIITGVCFGPGTGFLTGAITAFVSNFYFGQGPWTPYQMFALALLGGLAGLLFQNKSWERFRIPVSLFGGVGVMVVYGGIVNLGTVLMTGESITIPYVISVYLAGFFPFDMIHAGSTILFLFLLYRPLMKKLGRIKVKYGIMR